MNSVKSQRRSSAWPAALASLACLVSVAPALATVPVETRSVSVRYSNLDLQSAAGATALYHRLQGAARAVCGYGELDLTVHAYVNRCNRSAISEAVSAVNAPLLSAIHNAHGGASVTASLSE